MTFFCPNFPVFDINCKIVTVKKLALIQMIVPHSVVLRTHISAHLEYLPWARLALGSQRESD